MSQTDVWDNPFQSRYSSPEMLALWSPQRRIGTWRRLWVALAEAQSELGLQAEDGTPRITASQLAEMKAHLDDIDFEKAAWFEKQFRHDVMAHVHTFGDCCPSARGIIHLGATSCYVTDNGDLLLMKEGLHLLRSQLVAVLDADQEGFLRSDRSLIQTVGRAARHLEGRAILYADRITDSMQRCIDETDRRRTIQVAHNLANGITPKGVRKSIEQVRFSTRVADARMEEAEESDGAPLADYGQKKVAEPSGGYNAADLPVMIAQLEKEMQVAAKELDFEAAARLRDQLFELRVRSGDSAGARSGTSSLAADSGSRPGGAKGGRGGRGGRKSRGR